MIWYFKMYDDPDNTGWNPVGLTIMLTNKLKGNN